jgi:hypothetical protein
LESALKVLVYAPGDEKGEAHMNGLLQSLDLKQMTMEDIDLVTNGDEETVQSEQYDFKDLNDVDGKQDVDKNLNNDERDDYYLNQWVLMPMLATDGMNSTRSLTSSSLGDKLKDALERTRELLQTINTFHENEMIEKGETEGKASLVITTESNDQKQVDNQEEHDESNETKDGNNAIESVDEESDVIRSSASNTISTQKVTNATSGPVIFLGMDAPELPLDEISTSIDLGQSTREKGDEDTPNQLGQAYLNPAGDGGYGMLCVPSHAPSSIFEGVRWSCPLTAISQLKALSDKRINVTIGSLMRDVDNAEDLMNLAIRLSMKFNGSNSGKIVKDKNRTREIRSDVLSGNCEWVPMPIAKDSLDDENDKMPCCSETFRALQVLELVKRKQLKNNEVFKVILERWNSQIRL